MAPRTDGSAGNSSASTTALGHWRPQGQDGEGCRGGAAWAGSAQSRSPGLAGPLGHWGSLPTAVNRRGCGCWLHREQPQLKFLPQ